MMVASSSEIIITKANTLIFQDCKMDKHEEHKEGCAQHSFKVNLNFIFQWLHIFTEGEVWSQRQLHGKTTISYGW